MLVGKVDLSKNLLLAPMAEVTDTSFRKIAKKFGATLTFTQMVSARGVIDNEFDTLRYLAFSKEEKPIGVQILGNDKQLIYSAVKEILKFQPDVIDLNCGCPQNNVVKYNMGACLMDDPKNVGTIIKAMYNAAGGIPISAKFRLGVNKERINILENAKVAEDNGASYITVHARTRMDKYDSEPEWSWLAKIKEKVSIPVIGNGSIFTAQDAIKLREETGVDGVMVARGALGNPFIFSQFEKLKEQNIEPVTPDIDLVKDTVFEHINLLKREYGEIRSINYIKKNIIWYFKYVKGISFLIDKIFKLNSVSAIEDLIHTHVEKIKNDLYPEEDLEEIKEKFKMKVLFWLITEYKKQQDKH